MSSVASTALEGHWHSTVKQENLGESDRSREALRLPPPASTLEYPSPDSTTSRRTSSNENAELRRMTESESVAEAYSYPSGQGTRHGSSSSAGGGSYGPPSLSSTSPRSKQHPLDWPAALPLSDTIHGRDPLTLQIPKAHRQAHRSTNAHDDHHHSQLNLQQPTPRSSAASTATSLPSFAAFQEASTPRNYFNDELDDQTDVAPSSARLCCTSCTRLKPMVRDVAVAVAELDEIVQTFSTAPGNNRDLDFPKDNSARAVQWILERLRHAKSDLQAARSNMYNYQQPPPQLPHTGRDDSPSNPLKRHAGQWDEYQQPKRACSNASFDQPQRADSMDYLRSNSYTRSGYTPPPTASDPSTYQKIGSPGRNSRPLPSPASMQQYSHSATPSIAPTAQSGASPPTSYSLTAAQQSSASHNSNHNSASAAHIADLQHQVTLKSLALQTLQSEYASLLQKLQRERVKSQTIERKTTAADQEVNELTSKNEELTEQVKLLEVRAEDAEKKRETERADYARDKEQWGRMLDMGGKLQARLSDDKQKLLDEKDELLKRVNMAEQSRPYASNTMSSMAMETTNPGDDSALSRDNRALKTRVESLQNALDEILRCSRGLDEKARDMLQQNSNLENIVRRHLPDTQRSTARTSVSSYTSQFSGVTAANDFGRTTDSARGSVSQQQTSVPDSSNARLNASASSMMQFSGFGSSGTDMAYTYSGAKSSPEDLIKALGPVPTPAPNHNMNERGDYWSSKNQEPRGTFNPLTRTHSSGAMDEQSPIRPTTQAYHRSLPSPYSGPNAPLAYPRDSFASYASSPASQHNYGSPGSSSGSGEDLSIMPPPPRPYSNWQISYSPDSSGPRP